MPRPGVAARPRRPRDSVVHAPRAKDRRPKSPLERYLPLVYLTVALLVVALVLPSALRPPAQQSNQSAELSPNGPRQNQQSIIAAFEQASSGTAGAGAAANGSALPGGGTGGLPAGPPPTGPAGYCPDGFGSPRRQVTSLYAAPCAANFTGNNGGATAFGVTGNEIRVAVFDEWRDDGPVESASDTNQQIFKDFEDYFNSRFQFYGRNMRIYLVAEDTSTPPSGTAAADRAKIEYQVFAGLDALTTNPGLLPEAVHQQIVFWTYQEPTSLYSADDPYLWSWAPSTDRTVSLGDEMVCKQLVGRPPSYNGRQDASFQYSKPRKFGLVVMQDPNSSTSQDQVTRELAACGAPVQKVISYNYSQGSYNAASAITQLRAAGVTTVLYLGDQLTANILTNEANSQDYWPEWVPYGGNLTINAFMEGVNQAEWSHAVGVSLREIPRPVEAEDYYQAEQAVDPNGPPLSDANGNWNYVFGSLLFIADGIQLAGPHLTPEAFAAGLAKLPSRPPVPQWSIGGGFYGPDRWTYAKYAAMVWWDPSAIDPETGGKGAYRWLDDGRRYTSGQIPSAPLAFQQAGVTQPTDPSVSN
ncbi:MAG TPA: hypothetical protein VE990_05465 [Acidimicrobiales bacterium]|nr:hypothetical protein [Acidimicrobiales bacterium]